MSEAVIVAAKRTPIGKIGGMFKHVPPEQLVAEVIRDLFAETGIQPAETDDIILGNAVGPGGNVARLSALTAGLPVDVPGLTVDRQCGSGLEAISYAARLIQAGAGDLYLAGGVESISRAPWKIEKPTSLYQTSPPTLYTKARFSPEDTGDPDMGIAAENVAEKYGISRKDQDQFALLSHQKAVQAMQSGRYKQELTTTHSMEAEDECPRKSINLKRLSRLRPVFKNNGSVTIGNSCPLNDGAALVFVMSRDKAEKLELPPILKFVDAVTIGVDPNELGIGPVPAVRNILKRNHKEIENVDLVEFNEAFASQVIASLQALSIPWEKVNVGGGAIALGHPYGASGAILVTRLFHEMKNGSMGLSLATMGIGGGMGAAVLFEKMGL